jgi:hypothetical protein
LREVTAAAGRLVPVVMLKVPLNYDTAGLLDRLHGLHACPSAYLVFSGDLKKFRVLLIVFRTPQPEGSSSPGRGPCLPDWHSLAGIGAFRETRVWRSELLPVEQHLGYPWPPATAQGPTPPPHLQWKRDSNDTRPAKRAHFLAPRS